MSALGQKRTLDDLFQSGIDWIGNTDFRAPPSGALRLPAWRSLFSEVRFGVFGGGFLAIASRKQEAYSKVDKGMQTCPKDAEIHEFPRLPMPSGRGGRRFKSCHSDLTKFKRLVNFLNLRKNMKKASPMWHQRWGNIAQMVSAVAALCAVVGVIVQLYLIRGNAKEASARQVYMSYSEATLKYPQAFTTKPGEDQIRSG